jgi:hypothetical protein
MAQRPSPEMLSPARFLKNHRDLQPPSTARLAAFFENFVALKRTYDINKSVRNISPVLALTPP